MWGSKINAMTFELRITQLSDPCCVLRLEIQGTYRTNHDCRQGPLDLGSS